MVAPDGTVGIRKGRPSAEDAQRDIAGEARGRVFQIKRGESQKEQEIQEEQRDFGGRFGNEEIRVSAKGDRRGDSQQVRETIKASINMF